MRLSKILPQQGRVSYDLVVYDAASESNDESCAPISGPQCSGQADSSEDSGRVMPTSTPA